ncbi:hypothetical protein ACWGQ4_23195 [Streptomyces sp. NPDC055721]|uniref:hypothetical protein n=1 Tax=Streptomyces sp. NPDC127132 TaxID=3345374 RepID=UPI00363EB585
MTADKHAKRAARELAAREGISYTAARRRLGEAIRYADWARALLEQTAEHSPSPGDAQSYTGDA